MEIISIYEGYIYSVRYEGEEENEFDRLLDSWNDVQYLMDFFESHKALLANGFWNKMDPEKAAMQVLGEAEELEEVFDELAANTKEGKQPDFDSHFKFLGGKYKYILEYEPMKSYGTASPSFIRIYAIKLKANTYLITGGGLKLADTIQNSPGLKERIIQDIDRVRELLRENGVIDREDLENWNNN